MSGIVFKQEASGTEDLKYTESTEASLTLDSCTSLF